MAEIDSKAFDYMNEGDPDKSITGGAIEYSEYEMDMTSKQQKDFTKENTALFRNLYDADPLADKEKLPFKQWLKALSPERVRLLSEDYEGKDAPRDAKTILAKDLMAQASRHWGGKYGFNAIRDMVLEK